VNKRVKVEIVKPSAWNGLTLMEVQDLITSVKGLSQTYDPVLQFALYEFAVEIEGLLMEKNA